MHKQVAQLTVPLGIQFYSYLCCFGFWLCEPSFVAVVGYQAEKFRN